YDNTDDVDLLDNQDDFNINNLIFSSSYEFIHSGLHDIKFIDNVIFYLYLKDKFNIKKKEQQTFQKEPDAINYNDKKQVQSSYLNDEQKKAFLLVCNHCEQNYSDNLNKLPQLLMFLSGAEGTGKSKVINAIAEYFDQTNQKITFNLCAPTGVTASNIGNCTLYSLCEFGFDDDYGTCKYNFLKKILKKMLQERWANIEYVIIDKVSIIGQRLITQLHTYIKEAKIFQDDTIPFAGLNIIFVGDFLQLLPVLDQPLY
ncbi:9570_t:CDS:2, partial [Cetraspora pellucida]